MTTGAFGLRVGGAPLRGQGLSGKADLVDFGALGRSLDIKALASTQSQKGGEHDEAFHERAPGGRQPSHFRAMGSLILIKAPDMAR